MNTNESFSSQSEQALGNQQQTHLGAIPPQHDEAFRGFMDLRNCQNCQIHEYDIWLATIWLKLNNQWDTEIDTEEPTTWFQIKTHGTPAEVAPGVRLEQLGEWPPQMFVSDPGIDIK